MKKIIITLALAVGTTGVFAQGLAGFAYNSRLNGSVIARIYGPETDNPSALLTGNASSVDYPAGSTSYNGTLLGGATSGAGFATYGPGSAVNNGTLWDVELWGAPTTQGTVLTSSQLTTEGSYVTGGGNTIINMSTTALKAGYFNNTSGSTVYIPGSVVGGSDSLQLRAWYNGGGALSTWALGDVPGNYAGASPVFNIDNLQVSSGNSVNLVGLQTFNVALIPTPEPSTIALGVIGVSALLFRRRK
jgi:hypothetical protein